MEQRKALGRQTLRLLSIAVFLAIGLALTGCSNSEEAKDGETTVPSSEEVQSALEQAVAAGIPGIAVEIRGQEGSEFLAAGVASVEDERPLTSEDRFRIASVTKAFTAAVVMSEKAGFDTAGRDDISEDHDLLTAALSVWKVNSANFAKCDANSRLCFPFGSMMQTSHGERTPREGAGQLPVLLLDQGQLPYQNLPPLGS